MNIWIIILGTFAFFGAMLFFGLRASSRDHRLAKDKSQSDEWFCLPIENLDRDRYKLWRMLHVDKGVTPKRTIEDEKRIERASWEARVIY